MWSESPVRRPYPRVRQAGAEPPPPPETSIILRPAVLVEGWAEQDPTGGAVWTEEPYEIVVIGGAGNNTLRDLSDGTYVRTFGVHEHVEVPLSSNTVYTGVRATFETAVLGFTPVYATLTVRARGTYTPALDIYRPGLEWRLLPPGAEWPTRANPDPPDLASVYDFSPGYVRWQPGADWTNLASDRWVTGTGRTVPTVEEVAAGLRLTLNAYWPYDGNSQVEFADVWLLLEGETP
jgi:hypothetical protein